MHIFLEKTVKNRLKAHSDLSVAKIAIKLQPLLPSCSVATRWYASLSIH